MCQVAFTLDADLRYPVALASDENLQTVEIGSDVQIHHILKL